MYRFLMVDDEEIVRRGFETKIDWAGQGFVFLPPCENGRDAIAAIDELRPDVVMTDIHMPHADGITVAAHVMERHPEIIVVVLSGYDEFSYAQAAIRNKVFDYVLKPVSSRDLNQLLAKLRTKLDSDRRSLDDATALKELAFISGDLLKERGLSEFATGGAPPPSAPESILGFDPGPLACAALVVEEDEPATGGLDEGGLKKRLESAIRCARRAVAFFPSAGRGGALVFEQGLERCAAQALSAATALCEKSPRLRVGVGRAYARWIDSPRSYSEAIAALSYRLVREPGTPFAYVQASEDRDALSELRPSEERLCLAVRTGAAGRAPDLARAYLGALAAADISPQRVRHEVSALLSRSHDELAGIGISSAVLSAKFGGDFYGFAESLDRPEAIVSALESLAGMARSALGESSLHTPEWKLLDFKEYVARHYAEKKLTIGKAAERLSISESYLSKLIRRGMGRSFVDYLSDFRVDRAKELLAASDMMGYEVAEAVGYPDPRYFAAIFKRRTGMSPSEYRKSLGGAG